MRVIFMSCLASIKIRARPTKTTTLQKISAQSTNVDDNNRNNNDDDEKLI